MLRIKLTKNRTLKPILTNNKTNVFLFNFSTVIYYLLLLLHPLHYLRAGWNQNQGTGAECKISCLQYKHVLNCIRSISWVDSAAQQTPTGPHHKAIIIWPCRPVKYDDVLSLCCCSAGVKLLGEFCVRERGKMNLLLSDSFIVVFWPFVPLIPLFVCFARRALTALGRPISRSKVADWSSTQGKEGGRGGGGEWDYFTCWKHLANIKHLLCGVAPL